MPALEPPHVAGGCERRPLAAMLRRAGLGAGGIAPLPQNGGGGGCACLVPQVWGWGGKGEAGRTQPGFGWHEPSEHGRREDAEAGRDGDVRLWQSIARGRISPAED